MLSHLVPNCSSRRRYAMKDVAKDSWAPDTRLSLYLFISKPPRKIPTATAGRFNTPRRRREDALRRCDALIQPETAAWWNHKRCCEWLRSAPVAACIIRHQMLLTQVLAFELHLTEKSYNTLTIFFSFFLPTPWGYVANWLFTTSCPWKKAQITFNCCQSICCYTGSPKILANQLQRVNHCQMMPDGFWNGFLHMQLQ